MSSESIILAGDLNFGNLEMDANGFNYTIIIVLPPHIDNVGPRAKKEQKKKSSVRRKRLFANGRECVHEGWSFTMGESLTAETSLFRARFTVGLCHVKTPFSNHFQYSFMLSLG